MLHLHSLLRRTALAALLTAGLLTSGCINASIEDACSPIAESHCESCYSCADTVDGVSGAELCDVPAREGANQEACEVFLQDRCERQARTLQDPYDELDACESSLDEQTCNDLVEREALDRPAPPQQCERFL